MLNVLRKVAIITINDNSNIGNRLQNYAVSEILKLRVIEATTLLYFISDENGGFKGKVKAVAFHLLNYLGITNSKLFTETIKKNHKLSLVNDFDRKYINISKKYTFKSRNMKKYSGDFDFYCIGSDQIWNPALVQNSDFFFGNFAESEKVFSFSASMGTTWVDPKYRENFKKGFEHVGHISVREQDVSDYIYKTTGKDSVVLLDPTLLLDKSKWIEVAKKPDFNVPKQYVLIYFLGGLTDSQDVYIKLFAKKHDCTIIDILKDGYKNVIGPSEFVFLMKNAKMVFTDSFHGTAFSVIFRKQFVVFNRNNSYDMSQRITTLLNTMNISERFYNVKDKQITSDFLSYVDELKPYDVDSILIDEKKKADDFLQFALQQK